MCVCEGERERKRDREREMKRGGIKKIKNDVWNDIRETLNIFK